MDYLINKNINEIYDVFLSNKFINKVFKSKDIHDIHDIHNNLKIFYKNYEIDKIKNMPFLIKKFISIDNIKIKNIQELIQYEDGNLLKIRYTTYIIEPEYVCKILKNYNFKLLVTYVKYDKDINKSILNFEEIYSDNALNENLFFNNLCETHYETPCESDKCYDSREDSQEDVEEENNSDYNDDIKITDQILVDYIFIPFIKNIGFDKIKENYIKRIHRYYIK